MEFETALQAFLDYITEEKERERKERFPNLPRTVYSTMFGKKNVRIVESTEDGERRSVFCFIRIDDGAVLKPAGWNAPAKHDRGTIYTDNPADYGVTTYGAKYLV